MFLAKAELSNRLSELNLFHQDMESCNSSGVKILSHTYISDFPIGYEEVRSISNPPADVSLGSGFEIDVSAAAIMKRFEQISDEDLSKK